MYARATLKEDGHLASGRFSDDEVVHGLAQLRLRVGEQFGIALFTSLPPFYKPSPYFGLPTKKKSRQTHG